VRLGLLSSVSMAAALTGMIAVPAFAQPASPRTVGAGQTVTGTIGPEDPKLSSDNSSYELVSVQAPAGQMVTVRLTSAAFQPVLALGTTISDECPGCRTEVGEVGSQGATVSMRSPASGRLQARVNTMNSGESGAYSLAVTAAPAAPLRVIPLTFGRSVNGALAATDATNDDDSFMDAYSLRLAANQEVQIDLSATDFDPKLILLDAAGAKVQEDDDGGPGTNARIRFTAPRAGVYQIQAVSISEGQTGTYTLLAGARPVRPPMTAPVVLTLGRAATGTLSEQSPVAESDGDEKRVQRFSFTAQAGQTYRIEANSSAFDIIAAVGRLKTGGVLNALESDDDSGGNQNAALRFRAVESGVHVVEVASVGDQNKMGAFDVKVTQAPPDRPPAAAKPIALGQTLSGALVDGNARRADPDSLFDSYSIALTAGQTVVVRMNQPANDAKLDPFVQIGRGTPSAFEMLAEDDDTGPGLNARLRFTAPSAGTYLIRATTVNAKSDGAYSLNVAEPPAMVMPPAPTPLAIGATVTGALDASDPTRGEDMYFDRYVFTGQVGETYTIELKGEGFDAIVGARHLERVDDDYDSDDDGGEGTNSKLEYVVKVAGPQVVRVSSVGGEETGTYTLSLAKK
jgi:Bacterial pre-peptidase C-terminal domain